MKVKVKKFNEKMNEVNQEEVNLEQKRGYI